MVTLLYFWLVQETEISQREELDFFLKIDFYMNKTLHRHWRMGLGSYHILMRKNFDPLWSKLCQATTSLKRPPPLDILGGRLREVRL